MKSHANGHAYRGRLPDATFVVQVLNHFSIVQSVVAAAKVVFAMALLATPSLVAPVAVGLVTFGVYNANNLTDGDEDAVNSPRCAAFVDRHRRGLTGACVLACLAAVGLAGAAGGPLAAAVVLVPIVTGVLYSVPLIPGAGTDRLKDVFAVNTVLVAGAWAVTVTYLPVALSRGGVPLAHTVPVVALLFLRTFVSVEVFNVRDVDGDRASGVATLPASLGVPATQHVLFFLDAAALAVAVAAAAVVPPLALAALVAVTAHSMLLTGLLDRVQNLRLVCMAKDGEYVALGVVALALL